MRYFIAFATVGLMGSAWGAGSMSLKGKIVTLTPSQIHLTDGRNMYEINRTKIPLAEIAKLQKAKSGDEVEFWVPFEAITNVAETK